METQIESKKWYDNTFLLIILLFLFAPLGIYGIFKRKNTVLWKKLVYSVFGVGYLLFIIPMIIAGIYISNLDNYSEGNDFYKKGDLKTAIEYFSKVEKEDKNYKLAQQKIDEINSKLSQIEIQNKKQNELKLSQLNNFQKKWADSVVKSWKGDFIINSEIISADSIRFELSKNATKSFNSNRRDALPMYVSDYKKSVQKRFGSDYDYIKTVIDFSPNKELLKSSNPDEYTHPVFMNTGMSVYKGNQYSKELLGSLDCKKKDETDGETYFYIKKSNGGLTRIAEYDFRSNYWVKKEDPFYKSHSGINECY